MGRLFDYGYLDMNASLPNQMLPGQYVTAIGVTYAQAAIIIDSNDVEFGEVVLVVKETDRAVQIQRAGATITVDNAAFVIRDLVGQRVIEAGIVEGITAKSGIPATVVKANTPKGWGFAVPVAEAVVAGDPVYVGKGTGTTIAGALYKSAKGSGGADTLLLTDWVFTLDSYQPTDGTGIASFVTKK